MNQKRTLKQQWATATQGNNRHVPYASQLGYTTDDVGVVGYDANDGSRRVVMHSKESFLTDDAFIDVSRDDMVTLTDAGQPKQ